MKIIQITDTHLLPPGQTLHGTDPEAQLRRAVADVMARHGDADLLVMTGDLCNDGDPAAYALLAEILAPLPFPVRLLLGNHDARPAFVAAFPEQPRDGAGYVQSWLDTPQGRLLFLDSHAAGVIGGHYGPDRLDFLDEALAGAGARPVTVFIHHPPMDVGIGHFARIGLHDEGVLRQRLAAHPGGVRQVVFGHIHVELSGVTPEGLAYSAGQACAHRFITDIDAPDPLWTVGPPCYRVLMLDRLGLRAFALQVGEVPSGRAAPCAGP